MDLPQTGGKAGKMTPAGLAQALEQATVLVVSAGGDSGSGFFVAPNYVVTNHHVVGRAAPGSEALILSKHLKTGYIGTVVATSQTGQGTEADYAVIKVDDVPAGSVRPQESISGRVVGINTYIVTSRQTTKANYALGSSWLAAFLRGAKTPFDWRADSCA